MSVPPEMTRKPWPASSSPEPCVADDLRGVVAEAGLERFAEGHGLRRHDVHKRAALLSGEDGPVHASGVLLLAQDHAGARAAQSFVRGSGDDLRVRHGRGMRATCNQACEVRHVDEQKGADFIRDGAHAREIEGPGIGAAAADDELGLFPARDFGELVVVDDLGVLAHAVGGDAIELAGEVELVAVREMAAVSEIEAENGVARLEDGHVGGGIGLRAGVGLHVGVLGAEDLLGAVACEILDHVCKFATAVVAFAGIALRVLVGEDRSRGLKHSTADEVLGGDHLEALMLAGDFVGDSLGDSGVGLRERAGLDAGWDGRGLAGHVGILELPAHSS